MVSKCFYENGFLTYLFSGEGAPRNGKWKKVIHKPDQWHHPSCVLEDELRYLHSQALGLTVMG